MCSLDEIFYFYTMKIIKGLLYTIVIIILTFLTATVFAPSSVMVERSIIVDTNQKNVFDQISNFTTWPEWDAWYIKDTNQIRKYAGRFGASEHGFQWRSDNKYIGNGSMHFISMVDMDSLIYDVSFDDDEIIKASGYFHLTENNGQTSVKWVMFSSIGFPYKILNYFMDEMVGQDFERSLENFKNYIESNELEESSAGIVQIVNEFGIDYALIRKDSLPMGAMKLFFSKSYPLVYDFLRTKGMEPAGPSTGIYYEWDEVNFIANVAAAVPVSMFLPKEYDSFDFEFGAGLRTDNSVSCELKGGYSKSYPTHMAINKWLEDNHKIMDGPVIEEYVKGPYDTKDSSDYLTRITYHFIEADSN